VAEIFGESLSTARKLEVNTLAAMVFFNRGDRFEAVPLPPEAQWAPSFGVAGRRRGWRWQRGRVFEPEPFATNLEMGRNDAGRGLWLKGDGKGGLRAMSGQASGREDLWRAAWLCGRRL
jgi:hypothetical protein